MVEVGEIVLCTVDKISGTVVSVKLESGEEGSIILSEIAPGRIRNIRDYVVPNKTIVCKVLRINGDRIDLSLRRVSEKERKEMRELMSLEKSSKAILKTVCGNNAEKFISEILKHSQVHEFLEESKENHSLLESLVGKADAKKILEIVSAQKTKLIVLKKEFNLTSNLPDGIDLIKEILLSEKDVEIKYISAGRYSISAQGQDKKSVDMKIRAVVEDIKDKSSKYKMIFSFKEK